MAHARIGHAWLCWVGVGVWVVAAAARAQSPTTQPAHPRDDASAVKTRAPKGDHERGEPHSRPLRPPPGALGRRLFEPSPEDRGPLQPGEADELLAFAREHLPRLYEAMEQVRARNPDRLQERLSEHAPRLRHLQRVFGLSPQIGQIIQQHADNLFQMRRATRALRQADPNSSLYASTVQSLRERVAENVRLELDALRILADESEARAPQRIEARLNQLLAEDASLEGLPPRVRDFVRGYHEAKTDDQRQEARQQLQQNLTRVATDEIQALRQRVAQLEADTAGEVDARVQWMLDRARRNDDPRSRRPETDGDSTP